MHARSTHRILVIDDDIRMRDALNEAILRLGYDASVCSSGEEALLALARSPFALVVTDMRMPGMDGLSFLRETRRRNIRTPVLVITGFGTVENAVESMKEGAVDYLMKPFSYDALKGAVNGILSRYDSSDTIITGNPEMGKVVSLAKSLASNDITVLIVGESGTGKELLARFIHCEGVRAEGPFIAVNCAAIPDTLMESELFGHEKGAFTGAGGRKTGKFELAQGGTMLLDEISELPLPLQAKLLRVLQEREVDRIGGSRPVSIDVRVIATTNRDLAAQCREGRFREDLYYRLNVFPLKVPPLRERPEDILLLAERFREKYSALSGKHTEGFTDEAAGILAGRSWRGNVRELENAVQRAVFLCAAPRIDQTDFVFDDAPEAGGRIRDMERQLILKTLKEVNGNKTLAAKLLGVSVRTIRNKMNDYGQNFPSQ